jgi:hypothetical protein
MRKIFLASTVACLALASCSEAGHEASENMVTMDMAEPASTYQVAKSADIAPLPPSAPNMRGIEGRADIPVAMPKMAYVYDYGYRLEGERIAPLQQKHADMCAKMGPYSCQIVSLSHSGAEAEHVTGKLELAVIAEKAREFGKRLSGAADEAKAEEVASTIQGEDLSKAIVDTEARLRSRIVLRDRLMDVLRTRRGSVAELVEAERGVAQVNQEIDQARSWLEEMKGRVAYSRVNISYESNVASSGGFAAPVRSAFSSLGSVMGVMLAALIYILAIAGPLALAGLGIRAVLRRLPDRTVEVEA